MMIRQFHSIQVLSSAVSTMTQIQRRLLVTRELRSVKPPLDRSTLPSYQFIGSPRFQCDRMFPRNRRTISIATTLTTIVVPNNHHHNRPFSTTTTSPPPPPFKNNHMGLFRLLTDVQRTILIEQQQLTAQVRAVARRVGLPLTQSTTTLSSSSSTTTTPRLMEDIFQNTLVVVMAGEYNAGKSTVINALIGSKLLKTGALPTTDGITIISSSLPTYTENDSQNDTLPNVVDKQKVDTLTVIGEQDPTANSGSSSIGDVMYHPVPSLPLLRDLTIVDTPGTNAVLTDHTALTMRILPAADLIIFVTSADRPFPESERALLESIAVQYRKSIIVVLNKMDILDPTGGDHGMAEKRRVVQYVTEHASALLGAQPMVIPISARDALAAKLTGRVDHDPLVVLPTSPTHESVWNRSNFGSLERFLRDTLTTETKIKSKLSSPIGVAENVLDQCQRRLQSEQKEFETDIATLNLINSQFNAWKKELVSDMNTMNQEIQSMLLHEGQRGAVLLRRMNWKDLYTSCLFDTSLLRSEWEKTKAPLTIRQQNDGVDASSNTVKGVMTVMVSDMANSVALISRAQGQAMIEYLGKRPVMKNRSLLSSVTTASQYEDTRRNLHHNLMSAVNKHVDMKELDIQESFLSRIQTIVYCSMALNSGSICVATACLMQVVDAMVGVSTCTILCASSALTWHVGRQTAVDRYSSLWTLCSLRLDEDIKSISTKETDRVCRRIMDGITPYTLFVEAEQERLQQLSDQCEGLTATARQLRNRISDIG